MEKIGPEEVKDGWLVKLGKSGRYSMSLSQDLDVGCVASIFPVGTDMVRVLSGEISEEEALGDEVGDEACPIFTPMMLRAWYVIKDRGAISLREARRNPQMYVALLELLNAGLVRRIMTASGFLTFDFELAKRMTFCFSKTGKAIWEEFGCPE